MTTWNACFCLARIHQPGGSHHPTRYLLALVITVEEGAGLFPAERITADRQPMREPAAGDPETGCGPGPGLARNSCVRLESNGYSVHPAVIGQLIELTADLARVRVSRARPRLTHMLKAPNIRFWLASIEVAK